MRECDPVDGAATLTHEDTLQVGRLGARVDDGSERGNFSVAKNPYKIALACVARTSYMFSFCSYFRGVVFDEKCVESRALRFDILTRAYQRRYSSPVFWRGILGLNLLHCCGTDRYVISGLHTVGS